jgi:hypothetical protein
MGASTDRKAMSKFTVDTHLFRELGELLVGRDSTALLELIKNAYDADAREVTVVGDRLSDTNSGSIQIVDNGNGMSPKEFEQGFLRIASRMKEEGERRSPRFHRRYTGAKGIGRLAAHKLARLLSVNSFPREDRLGVQAMIDWDEIEKFQTLDDVAGTSAVKVDELTSRRKPGTTIFLTKLRRRWTSAERERFISEIQTFSAPEILLRLPSILPFPLLISNVLMREAGLY